MKTLADDAENLKETVSRRQFLSITAALSVVGLAGCGTMGNQSSTGSSGSTEERVLAKAITGTLFSVAGGANLQDGEALVFTLPDGGNAGVLLKLNGQLRAMSAKCTHAGCVVAWQNAQLHCACHGSNFDANGKVLKGPAKKDLPQWTVSAQGNDAIVTT